ncbi:DNA polymerase III subunit delta [Marivirga lumbricoides]|uniref:DNA polymerase III subunit delta n=1 Tax=Marivirga lumbricoides TaxID=1046115 RepID=A0ABQ1LGH2_9BACT|nr:DNA polymerase III subunit delta [Marivirga lumbricoides]
MTFAEIPGLDDLKKQLIKGVKNNHIAHAQLFLGNSGSANLPMAIAYATYLNCENRGEEDACGVCASCQKNAKYIHPDFHFSFPTAANDQIKGSDAKISQNFLKPWRQFLIKDPFASVTDWVAHLGVDNKQLNISREESRQIIKSLSLKAFEGRYKVMLIWLPEFLHPSAANALLKIIEEPAEKTVFLLVSNNQGKLLGTITSRTQSVHVPAYSDDEILEVLTKRYQIDPRLAKQLAHIAQGDLHKALSLSDDVSDDTQAEFEQWMRECYTKDYASMVKRSESFHKFSKVNQQQWLIHAENIYRESLMALMQTSELMRIPAENKAFVEKFSKTITLEKVAQMTDVLNKASYYLERNASPKMTFLNVSIQISGILRAS